MLRPSRETLLKMGKGFIAAIVSILFINSGLGGCLFFRGGILNQETFREVQKKCRVIFKCIFRELGCIKARQEKRGFALKDYTVT